MYTDLIQMCESAPKKSNLSKAEQKALDELTKNHNIIIKAADKGGGIVVQGHCDYMAESLRLLSDANTYSKLTHDPLPEFTMKATSLANRALEENNLQCRTVIPYQGFPENPLFLPLTQNTQRPIQPPRLPYSRRFG